jgi:hypothetical protein
LKKTYECGLVEIIYPTVVKNVPFNVNIHLKLRYSDVVINLVTGTIPSRHYKTEQDLFDIIKLKMDSVTKEFVENKIHLKIGKKLPVKIKELPEFRKNNKFVECINGEVTITQRKIDKSGTLFWEFDDYLHQMLGFSEAQESDNKTRAKYPVDIYGQCHSLYVYTNIIQPSFVGQTKSQLLRIIPLENPATNQIGSMKSVTFNPILFFPLRHLNFDMIEIQIRDSTGRYILFEFGKVIVTLLFQSY